MEISNIDIACLQNTSFKLPISTKFFSHTYQNATNPNKILHLPKNYLSWSTSDSEKTYEYGVTIIVKKPLTEYVYKIQKYEGYEIAITFAFKGNYQSTIVTVYNSSFMNKPSLISPKLEK